MFQNITALFEICLNRYNEEEKRRVRVLVSLYKNIAAAALLGGVLGVLLVFREKSVVLALTLVSLGFCIAGMLLLRGGRLKASAVVLLSSLWLLSLLAVFISGGAGSFDMMFLLSGTVIAGIVSGFGASLVYGALSLAVGLIIYFAQSNGFNIPVLLTISPPAAWLIFLINLVMVISPLHVVLNEMTLSTNHAVASEQRFRMITAVISDYAFYVHFDQRGETVDQWLHGAFEAITGYTPDEYFSRGGWRTIVHPLDREKDLQDFARLQANQKVVTEIRLLAKNGETKWVKSYATPMWDEQTNSLAGIYGAVQDITLQKATQENLHEREAILAAVADSAERLFKSDDWQREMNSVLELLGTSIGSTHAYFFENRLGQGGDLYATLRFEWTAPGFESDMNNPLYHEVRINDGELQSWDQAMQSNLPYIGDVKKLDAEDYAFLKRRGLLALLDIPIYVDNRWVGIMGFDDAEQAREWSPTEIDTLRAAGNIVGAAIKRQQDAQAIQDELASRQNLIAELERRNAISQTLHESAAIVAATLDQTEAISGILEQLEKVIEFDSASVQLLHGDFLQIVSARGFTPGDHDVALFPVNEQEPAYPLIRAGFPYVLYDDVQEAVPAFNDVPHDNIRSWMAVPLRARNRLIGIIAMDSKKRGRFKESDAQLAITYANQVAIAVENSRLFQELQSELVLRQELIDELEAKNAELERYAYTVSHDLRSPLVTIKGFIGFIEKSARAGRLEAVYADLKRISDAADRMDALLRDLLELSRIGRMINKLQFTPLSEIVREAREATDGMLQKKNVTLYVQTGLPVVFGDRPRLVEVFQNLIDNAAKYMGAESDPRIEIGVESVQDDLATIFVRDNGIGIPPEYHERVFGLFEKLDAGSEGTGIGLALVRRIVEFHEGRIWLESAPGLGSTFKFTLKTAASTEHR